jgi:hypothetical protein
MNATGSQFADLSGGECRSDSSLRNVPWQIWVVVALLAIEGIFGNLPLIPQVPQAAIWFAAKCLFVVGLVRGWRWVFVLFLVVGAIHVLVFSIQAPFVAFLNLVLMVLTSSALRFYFPKSSTTNANLLARRSFWYGFWALLVLSLAGISLNGFLAEWDRAKRQRTVVEALEKTGPRMKIEYYTSWPATFLQQVIGKDGAKVFAVDASSVRDFDDQDASYLAKLPDLQALCLMDTQITDAGLKHIEGLTNVQYMMLGLTQITDAGLDHLKGLAKLKQLDVKGTKVTDEGVARLQRVLPRCRINK